MLTPQQPAELLSSVVPGERRGRPGAARAAALAAADEWPEARNAFRMIAVYGSLAAGEPREALRLLDGIEQADESVARRIAACRPWAQTWERNWYPGDIGGEVPPNYRPDVFESNRVRQGDPETVLIEACAALGPGTVLTAPFSPLCPTKQGTRFSIFHWPCEKQRHCPFASVAFGSGRTAPTHGPYFPPTSPVFSHFVLPSLQIPRLRFLR